MLEILKLIETSSDEELRVLITQFEAQLANPSRSIQKAARRALEQAREEQEARELLRVIHSDQAQ